MPNLPKIITTWSILHVQDNNNSLQLRKSSNVTFYNNVYYLMRLVNTTLKVKYNGFMDTEWVCYPGDSMTDLQLWLPTAA